MGEVERKEFIERNQKYAVNGLLEERTPGGLSPHFDRGSALIVQVESMKVEES